MIGVGGAFDHIAGVRKRAPGWIQRIHLEWLFRLITQPWRWRRQLALPQFVWAVMRQARQYKQCSPSNGTTVCSAPQWLSATCSFSQGISNPWVEA